MDDEPDLMKWIDIFDSALTSTNPLVKEQLSKLLMIATLASSTDPIGERGPFRTLYTEIKSLREGVAQNNHDLKQLYYQVKTVRYNNTDDSYHNTTASDLMFGPPRYWDDYNRLAAIINKGTP